MQTHAIVRPAAPFLRRISLLALVAMCSGTSRGAFQTNEEADVVLGNQVNQRFGFSTTVSGVAVDAVSHKVFVADKLNNRVLRFGSVAALSNGAMAECIFGQQSLDERGPGTGAQRMNQPGGCTMDAGGRLWVADSGNNRVLRFDNAAAAASYASAAVVLGQPNFAINTGAVAQDRMNFPGAVVVDAVGRLWVADTLNNRVLRFDNAAVKATGGTANAVIGQGSYTTTTLGTGLTNLNTPNSLAVFGTDTAGDLITLWIGDGGPNRRVLRFNSVSTRGEFSAGADGTLGFVGVAAADAFHFSQVSGVAVDATGALYVSDQLQARVLRFNSAKTKATGAAADAVLGQVNFNSTAAGFATSAMSQPLGLAVDGARLWVVDSGNQRVLRFDAANTKNGSVAADSFLGRKSEFDPNAVTASTIATPRGVAIDPTSGKLFVADRDNNRVLRWASALSLASGAPAEAVLGQAGFTSITPSLSATGMIQPSAVTLDAAGRLWVADSGNARVLKFNGAATLASGSAANTVLGQANFDTATAATTNNRLINPNGVAVDSSGRLFVSDTSSNRILRWDNAASLANGANANGVIGQGNFTNNSGGLGADELTTPLGLAVDSLGGLFVADAQNNRVLRFDAPASAAVGIFADAVYGQPDFATNSQGTSSVSMKIPQAVAIDGTGRLFISDTSNHRTLWFHQARQKSATGASADGVFGQPNFSSFIGSNSPTGLIQPNAIAIDPAGNVWCADTGNRRVVRFPALFQEILECGLNAQQHFCLLFAATPGHSYQVRTSANLQSWSIATTLQPANSIVQWVDPAAVSGKKFYRVFEP